MWKFPGIGPPPALRAVRASGPALRLAVVAGLCLAALCLAATAPAAALAGPRERGERHPHIAAPPAAYGPPSYAPHPYAPRAYAPRAYAPRAYAPPAYGPPAYGPGPGEAGGYDARAYGRSRDSLGADWRPRPDEARQGVRAGRLAPLGRVIDQIRRRAPGRQLDAGLETDATGRSVYRVRWAGADGRRSDYIVDAETGRILGVDGR